MNDLGTQERLEVCSVIAPSGHLDAQKIATTIGDKYLVTPQSVARHIAQIVELSQLDVVATGRDHVATCRDNHRSRSTGGGDSDRKWLTQ